MVHAFLFFSLMLIAPIVGLCQSQYITDSRDGRKYQTILIDKTVWMTENLNYKTDMSLQATNSMKRAHNLENTKGRYYHYYELDSVCPSGWQLPTYQDWFDYFKYLNEQKGMLAELETMTIDNEKETHHHFISGYNGVIDLFESNNPLKLEPIGRFQADILSTNPKYPFADYWSMDPKEDFAGKSHAHLMIEWSTIHSHDHHLDPKKPNELRRFMVRCVKINAKN